MSLLRPVRGPYDPGYPAQLSEDEIARLLRPGLFSRFDLKTILTGAVISVCTLTAVADSSGMGNRLRADARAKDRALRMAKEILGTFRNRNWNEHASIRTERILGSNPEVKFPRIPISFGNSYCGIFDTSRAIEATRKLFEAYGINVRNPGRVRGEGFCFEADGWDPRLKVGFKLLTEDSRRSGDEKKLDEAELPKLDNAIRKGKLRVFVARADRYPNMDGDLYTPMEYYLASVVDYLNWIHGERAIDKTSVLGRVPKGE